MSLRVNCGPYRLVAPFEVKAAITSSVVSKLRIVISRLVENWFVVGLGGAGYIMGSCLPTGRVSYPWPAEIFWVLMSFSSTFNCFSLAIICDTFFSFSLLASSNFGFLDSMVAVILAISGVASNVPWAETEIVSVGFVCQGLR